MPLWQMRFGGRPPISSPANVTEPAVGAYMPAMQLKVVLLPEPFGPIRPRISPSLTSNETFETAVKPPNILVRPETDRRATGSRAVERQSTRSRRTTCGPRDGLTPSAQRA